MDDHEEPSLWSVVLVDVRVVVQVWGFTATEAEAKAKRSLAEAVLPDGDLRIERLDRARMIILRDE
jgi:hypothetical protein